MTAEAASRVPTGEAGFRLIAEHLPDLILFAFDPELEIWAATGAAIRARGWTAGDFVGRKVPEVGRPADAAITEGLLPGRAAGRLPPAGDGRQQGPVPAVGAVLRAPPRRPGRRGGRHADRQGHHR